MDPPFNRISSVRVGVIKYTAVSEEEKPSHRQTDQIYIAKEEPYRRRAEPRTEPRGQGGEEARLRAADPPALTQSAGDRGERCSSDHSERDNTTTHTE